MASGGKGKGKNKKKGSVNVEDVHIDSALGRWRTETEFPRVVIVKKPPSAAELVHPVQSGWLLKRAARCGGCLGHYWKERFMIMKGAYVWKFEHETGEKPKGVPISLLEAKVSTLSTDDQPHVLLVSTLRKTYQFATESKQELDDWVQAFETQRNVAIKQTMGHMPISEDDQRANGAGDWMTKRKAEQSLEEANRLLSHDQLNQIAAGNVMY